MTVPFIILAVGGLPSPEIEVSDLGTVEDTGTDSSSFAYGSFGAEAADRDLIACISTRDTATLFTADSITIGGVAATIIQSAVDSANTITIIARARVPTGASGNVVVNWSEAIAQDQLCTLLRVTGMAAGAATDSGSTNAAGATTSIAQTGIDWSAGSLVVGIAAWGSGADPLATWTGLATIDAAVQATDTTNYHFVGHEVKAAGATGQTITANITDGGSRSNRSITVAVFALA